ncbi:MAG: DUF3179 domain-containing protein [Candidatus Eisenbacteria bacterium]|nr:DUF3179 domain-containing protein [Candidatus Eisenbacteria bacterium]
MVPPAGHPRYPTALAAVRIAPRLVAEEERKMKTKLLGTGLVITAAAAILLGCTDSNSGAQATSTDPPGDEEPILITDRTGKEWDVTYAVKELGFKVEDFNFGLGPDAIPPIVDPQFIAPGEEEYPSPDAAVRVLGMTAGDDARAYPVTDIAGHEVVNDRVGDLHFAATY